MGSPEAKACAEKREQHTPSPLWSATKGGPGLASPVPSTTTHSGRAGWAENLSHHSQFTNRRAAAARGKSTCQDSLSDSYNRSAPTERAPLSSFQGPISANLQLTAIGARCRGARAEASTPILAILEADTTKHAESELRQAQRATRGRRPALWDVLPIAKKLDVQLCRLLPYS